MRTADDEEPMPEVLREFKPGNLEDATFSNYERWRKVRDEWLKEHR